MWCALKLSLEFPLVLPLLFKNSGIYFNKVVLFDIELYITNNITACIIKLILTYIWNAPGYSFANPGMTGAHRSPCIVDAVHCSPANRFAAHPTSVKNLA